MLPMDVVGCWIKWAVMWVTARSTLEGQFLGICVNFRLYQFLKASLLLIGQPMVNVNYKTMFLPFECWKHMRSHLKTEIGQKNFNFKFYHILVFLFYIQVLYFVCGLKQYLLRSGSGEVICVPINIQSVGDTEYLGMLASQDTSTEETSDCSSDGEQEELVVGQ